MRKRRIILSPGARTVKTIAAVLISMLIVDAYGTTSSKLIFAMLGAMAAMEPTFKQSVSACLTQVVGVLLGKQNRHAESHIADAGHGDFQILHVCSSI